MQRTTALSVEELSFLVALFCRVNECKPGPMRAHLSPTAREAFDAAVELVDANDKLVRALRRAPETLADGVFKLEEPKGILGRIFKAKDDDAPELASPSQPTKLRSQEEQRRLEEARALVDEAFGK